MRAQGWVGWMLGAMMPLALAAPMTWNPVGETQHYTLSGGGDVLSADGASLTVESKPGAAKGFGGGSVVVDATPYRLQRVRLSGRVSTRGVEGIAGLWLRADAAAGKVAFANTQNEPVSATADNVLREVEIYIPATADRVLLGPLLTGTGRMTVSGLRLERVPAASDDGVAPALIVEEAVRLIRVHALNADRIDWKREQADISRRMQQVSTSEDAYGLIRSLLGKLQDRHSGLLRRAWSSAFPPRAHHRSSPWWKYGMRLASSRFPPSAVPMLPQARSSRAGSRRPSRCTRPGRHAAGWWTCAATAAATCGRCCRVCIPCWETRRPAMCAIAMVVSVPGTSRRPAYRHPIYPQLRSWW